MARPVATSVDALLADATSREPMRPADGLSAVPMERVVIDGEPHVAKWLSYDGDWVMRATGDEVCRPVVMWETGLYDEVSAFVDPLVVGASRDLATGTCVLLMRDASGAFLPDGAAPINPETQANLLRDMAALHAGMWGFTDTVGLCSPEELYGLFSFETLQREADRGPLVGVQTHVRAGWEALREEHPALTDAVLNLAGDPAPLGNALAETPRTLVHHDWKGGNLGCWPDGRTILVDWAFPGASGGCADLAWYLAVNCDRLPTSKEATIRFYQESLQSQGIETQPWWERQLALGLVGAFVQLGWSKSGAELDWWVEQVRDVAFELVR